MVARSGCGAGASAAGRRLGARRHDVGRCLGSRLRQRIGHIGEQGVQIGRVDIHAHDVLHIGGAAGLGQGAHAQDVGHALGGRDDAAGIEQVEGVAALQHRVVGRQRQGRLQGAQALHLAVGELLEEEVGVGHLEVELGILALVLQVHVAVGELHAVVAAGPHDVVHVVDALDEHGEALKPVGDLHGHRVALEAAHLLEVGELGHFHAVDPDLPAQAPGAQRRALPVVFHEAHVVGRHIDADGLKTSQVQVLDVVRRGLDEHLELVVELPAVGVLAVAAVGGTAAALHVAGAPGVGPQRAQRGGRGVRAGAHLVVVGLQHHATGARPVALQVHDDVLEGGGRRLPGLPGHVLCHGSPLLELQRADVGQRPVDEYRLARDARLLDGAEVTGILGIGAVVPHNPQAAGGHRVGVVDGKPVVGR